MRSYSLLLFPNKRLQNPSEDDSVSSTQPSSRYFGCTSKLFASKSRYTLTFFLSTLTSLGIGSPNPKPKSSMKLPRVSFFTGSPSLSFFASVPTGRTDDLFVPCAPFLRAATPLHPTTHLRWHAAVMLSFRVLGPSRTKRVASVEVGLVVEIFRLVPSPQSIQPITNSHARTGAETGRDVFPSNRSNEVGNIAGNKLCRTRDLSGCRSRNARLRRR